MSDVEEDTDDGLSHTGVVDHLCVCVYGCVYEALVL